MNDLHAAPITSAGVGEMGWSTQPRVPAGVPTGGQWTDGKGGGGGGGLGGIAHAADVSRVKSAAPDFTDSEAEAAAYYLGSGSKPLNRGLRGVGKKVDKEEEIVAALNSAIDKSPRNPYDKLTRVMGGNPTEVNEFLDFLKANKGKVVYSDSYLSTSGPSGRYDPGGTPKAKMKIKAKPGSMNSGHVHKISEYGMGEDEVLFKPGSAFKVKNVKIKKGQPAEIELEEV